MAFNVASGGTSYLGSSIGSTDNTILLSSFLDSTTGVPITMATMNTSIAYATIAPRTSSSEIISFTGVTQNANGTATLTGVVRGLNKQYPFTTNVNYQLPHAGQSVFILSDAPQVFEQYSPLGNANEWTAINTFDLSPIVPTPTTATQAANKSYVDGVAIAGAPNASTTVKGIGTVSVAPVSPTSPIFVGDNDTRMPTIAETAALVGNDTTIAIGTGNKVVTQTGLQNQSENYGVTTGSANAYVLALSPIPTAYKAGQIIRFTTNFANTGSATINVNSLGAKTLQLNGSALTSGQLANGATYQATYDGTYFQVQTPIYSNVFAAAPAQYIPTITNPSFLNIGYMSAGITLNSTSYFFSYCNASSSYNAAVNAYKIDTVTGQAVFVASTNATTSINYSQFIVLGSVVIGISASTGTFHYSTFNGTTFSAWSAGTMSGYSPTAYDFEQAFTDGTYVYLSLANGATPTYQYQFKQFSYSSGVLTATGTTYTYGNGSSSGLYNQLIGSGPYTCYQICVYGGNVYQNQSGTIVKYPLVGAGSPSATANAPVELIPNTTAGGSTLLIYSITPSLNGERLYLLSACSSTGSSNIGYLTSVSIF